MDTDKEFIKKLWNNKWTRWIMIFGASWQVITGVFEPVKMAYAPIHKYIVYYLGLEPQKDQIVNDRASLIAGYLFYEVRTHVDEEAYRQIPDGFVELKQKLEAVLLTLKSPKAGDLNNLKPDDHKKLVERLNRIEHISREHIDQQYGERYSSLYHAGYNLAALLDNTSTINPHREEIIVQLESFNRYIAKSRKLSLYQLPTLPTESYKLEIEECCDHLSILLTESGSIVAHFYGIDIKYIDL